MKMRMVAGGMEKLFFIVFIEARYFFKDGSLLLMHVALAPDDGAGKHAEPLFVLGPCYFL